MKQYLFITFIILFFSQIQCQQPEQNKTNSLYSFKTVDSLILSAIEDSAFPGAVVLVSKNNKIIYEQAFGKFTYNNGSKEVKKNTIYDLASLTKVIATTTAAMICYDRKLFSLDDPVYKYIPEFAQNRKEGVTIKNLLLHNSGLPAYKRFYNKYTSAQEVIEDIYQTRLENPPGSKFIYSDLGMIVLAKLIEKVTGKKFDVFCNEEIFKPLNMNSTFFNPPDSLKKRIAPAEIDNYWRKKLVWGKVHDETAYLLNGVAGHAGLFSTAEDINHLLQMLLAEGKFNNRQIIKKETVKLFTKRFSDQSTRALGWDTKSEENSSAGNFFDITSFGHTGFTGTSVWIDPTRTLSVIFLTNRVYPSRENKKIYKVRPALHDAVIIATD